MSTTNSTTKALISSLQAYKNGIEEEESAFQAWCSSNASVDMRDWLSSIDGNLSRFLKVADCMEASKLPKCGGSLLPSPKSGTETALCDAFGRLEGLRHAALHVLATFQQTMERGQQSAEDVTNALDSITSAASSLAAYKEHYSASLDASLQALEVLVQSLQNEDNHDDKALNLQRALLMSHFSSTLVQYCKSLQEGLPADAHQIISQRQNARAETARAELQATRQRLLMMMLTCLVTQSEMGGF